MAYDLVEGLHARKRLLAWLGAALVVMVVFGLLWFFTGGPDRDGEDASVQFSGKIEDQRVGERMADFRLAGIDEAVIDTSVYRAEGKALVVNSWASWCPYCVGELPDFADVQEEYDGALVVIAVNRQESASVAGEYLDGLGVRDGFVVALDPGDAFYQSIGGFAMPETMFVDANGVIVEIVRGVMDRKEIARKVERLFASGAGQEPVEDL